MPSPLWREAPEKAIPKQALAVKEEHSGVDHKNSGVAPTAREEGDDQAGLLKSSQRATDGRDCVTPHARGGHCHSKTVNERPWPIGTWAPQRFNACGVRDAVMTRPHLSAFGLCMCMMLTR
jgi:hypothetical protein